MTTLRQLTCVAVDGRAVLIDGASGTGKSSLALALIDRGATLVGDDGVALRAEHGVLYVSPAPATRGLIELRGVGLASMATAADVPAALLIRLTADAPRYLEQPPHEDVLGIALPLIHLYPDSPVLALRAEMALRIHGLNVRL